VNPAGLQIGPQAATADDARETAPADAATAIVAFRDALQARGIHLLVVPMPVKASVYPEQLARHARGADPPVYAHTHALIAELVREGVQTVDLFTVFRVARAETAEQLYLRQDTHWTPEGMALAARTVAERLTALGWVSPGNTEYALRPFEVERPGDIVLMMKSPWITRCYVPETVSCEQVVDPSSSIPYKDIPGAEVLVLGDSFLRIYQQDEPGAAGFTAHLAHALRQPVESIVNDGGASTLVRQELSRRPALLTNKKVVVWEFVERDVRFGTEGWQDVPLPKS
jgi:lysophospholipase L1-like esterase